MPRLKDRNKFIPNGFTFYQPETRWSPPRMASFETIVSGIIAHRQANPYLQKKHGWPTDVEAVRNELDEYNAKVCEQMGWTSYITGGSVSSPPLPMPPPHPILQKGRNVVAGAETLVDWIASGAEAVPAEKSAARATVCAGCARNSSGDMLSFFTRADSEAIRRTIQRKNQMNLTTAYDDKLGVCEVCSCPLKLKVHLPPEHIKARLSDEVIGQLPDWCWIRKELA